jgi:hypothetical protein
MRAIAFAAITLATVMLTKDQLASEKRSRS